MQAAREDGDSGEQSEQDVPHLPKRLPAHLTAILQDRIKQAIQRCTSGPTATMTDFQICRLLHAKYGCIKDP